MATKTTNVIPPKELFREFKDIKDTKDILEQIKGLKDLEAKYVRRIKTAKAQKALLLKTYQAEGKNLAEMIRTIQKLEAETDYYVKEMENVLTTTLADSKEGEMAFRRASDHVKTLTEMYKTWEKEEKKGDQRKTEMAEKAYQKAYNNAQKDLVPVQLWMNQMSDYQQERDRFAKSDFEENLKELAAILQEMGSVTQKRTNLSHILEFVAKEKELIKKGKK